MTTFLPKDYKVPSSSGKYMRFKQGDNKIRVLSKEPLIGYEYWTLDRKPVRSKERPTEQPDNMKIDKGNHWQAQVKHFWAFVIWDYSDNSVKILQITQSGIQNSLMTLFNDKDWGHPTGYDILITRSGEGIETRYSTNPKPHSEIDKEISKTFNEKNINLEALYTGDDPFSSEPTDQPVPIKVEEIPF